ncbi:uncharacterized protein AMSG_08737 [Thecamonas trahens ATCC 50062]|uniref:Uncharacterized protein n=1 Tax=Thecamonas trahens ATCC 50062 TaxID=461836 RepID=A0A0L0DLQ6_THETB|nr:hypothetical protein AMSG_08737 [Thecamonas trahens ATCC 50062]KNC53249.1 hypothetical protein AMSG_08737 [Thecamonas trahens ATCC 50062]|eukprot:XP_013754513.1 hypothetical protein AMSG_08737 [Thecamonas trahens ATCC 50062]
MAAASDRAAAVAAIEAAIAAEIERHASVLGALYAQLTEVLDSEPRACLDTVALPRSVLAPLPLAALESSRNASGQDRGGAGVGAGVASAPKSSAAPALPASPSAAFPGVARALARRAARRQLAPSPTNRSRAPRLTSSTAAKVAVARAGAQVSAQVASRVVTRAWARWRAAAQARATRSQAAARIQAVWRGWKTYRETAPLLEEVAGRRRAWRAKLSLGERLYGTLAWQHTGRAPMSSRSSTMHGG